ncbi:MAG TPA: Gfo/Idh/MocA family oxidoreductase [Armatimonadota bacterium]|nr:Gfo/Idh/MocA family oxidoreductase [Armatimonadota bacterium]
MPIKFGVIGCRRGRSFMRVCAAVGGATVAAIYDVDRERADAAATEVGARAYGELDAFLESGIEAVVVASPLPYHAGQAVAALERGVHVLSEVTACHTVEDAAALVGAARRSSAVYMLAENYRYLDEVELVRRMADDGRFGEIYFGEGEYLHDCKDLWRNPDGSLTWRGTGGLGVYCTHSLGPLLYIFRDRVSHVSAMANEGITFDPDISGPVQYVMQMRTARGRVLRVRVDHTSPRPHQMAYYLVQGSSGAYEAWRGHGDRSKVWLADEHEPSRCAGGTEWHDLAGYREQYIPDRLAVGEEARTGGHGTSEYWLLRDFLAAVRGEAPSPIDVHAALDYTMPGILAVESHRRGGAVMEVPDSRLA